MAKKIKSSGRFGARYGSPLKQKRILIEEKQNTC